ncbi:MAG: peptidoglycan DD-metalloendopeptidase family protein [bacterium]|nr:peptidoglycan DD-metalloendopeptidase family protein [bacterium]
MRYEFPPIRRRRYWVSTEPTGGRRRRLWPLIGLFVVSFLLGGCQFLETPLRALKRVWTPFIQSSGDKGKQPAEERAAKIPPPAPPVPAGAEPSLQSGKNPPPDAMPDTPESQILEARFTTQDTAYGVLEGQSVSAQEIAALMAASRESHPLSKIRPGHWYELVKGAAGVHRFLLQVDDERQLRVYRTRSGVFRARMEKIPYEVELVRLEGAIDGSLFGTVSKSGGSPVVAQELVDIFGWVIDFHKDLHPGDRINVLLEMRSFQGRPAGFGRILAAEIVTGETRRTAIFFDRGGAEYYTPEGETIRRAFLRSPLRYTRISSKFSRRRFHPVLKRFRPHYGVDYAAPPGTPVRAVADGQVIWAGWRGAAGKMVRIRHGMGFETSYLHLSRLGMGVRRGVKVQQGKVIGHVGSTGLSTGPHLDYRIKKNGRPLDPLKAGLPSGMPVPKKHREVFFGVVQLRQRQLNLSPFLVRRGSDVVAMRSPVPGS